MSRLRKNIVMAGLTVLAGPVLAWSAVPEPATPEPCHRDCEQQQLPDISFNQLFPLPDDLRSAIPDYTTPEGFAAAQDEQLQQQLQRLLSSPALARAIREKRFAAALVDITDPVAPRLASVNRDVMIYAASLPKIAILLGVFEKAQREGKQLDEHTLEKARRMIRNSSNSAATELYYAVGPSRLAGYLQEERYRLYDRNFGGGLWVGKPYARRDTWKRDPIANLSHGATAFQVARFLYLLETGQLVSPAASARMKQILGKPAIRHKFVKGLAESRPRSRIFRKSGTWRTYHADAGIIERDGRRYIAVILANDPAGSNWLSRLIVQFDRLIHS